MNVCPITGMDEERMNDLSIAMCEALEQDYSNFNPVKVVLSEAAKKRANRAEAKYQFTVEQEKELIAFGREQVDKEIDQQINSMSATVEDSRVKLLKWIIAEEDWVEWDRQIEQDMERLGIEEWRRRLRGESNRGSSKDFMREEYR